MNLVFLTMSPFYDLKVHNIYSDMLLEFVSHGHMPYLVSPCEVKNGKKTTLIDKGDYKVLLVEVGNLSNVSFFEKGLSTVLMEHQFITAIKKFLSDVRFGLILYSTPPVTFARVIEHLKKTTNAPTYLLLKDIFPQNALDLGLLSKTGLKSVFYKYFRSKEKKLYAISDFIGCMSPANVEYVIAHNSEISIDKVHTNPNSIIAKKNETSHKNSMIIREKYCIPPDAITFIYGGNLGKPQDIPFIVRCLKDVANICNAYFIICGTGTDYPLLEKFFQEEQPSNMLLISGLPKQEYDELLQACDVGLIFLDCRFTIPNFPSRILSYMEEAMPILACTDKNTDIGEIITQGNFGWWCESKDVHDFTTLVDTICSLDSESIALMGNNARTYLENNYTVEHTYNTIMKHFA